jgi:DNA-binding protein HU-beta
MNRPELIDFLHKSGEVGETKIAAERALAAVLNAVKAGLKKDGNVQLVGFGTFIVRKRAARWGRNPRTGEKIKIKPSKTVGFKRTYASADSRAI